MRPRRVKSVVVGRRGRRSVCVAATTAVAIIVAVSAETAPGGSRSEAAARWRIVDLGTLGGSSYATAINERGQVIGVSAGHAFLWTNGKLRDLGNLRGRAGNAVSLNNRGEVVLTRATAPRSYAWHAFLWRKGKLIDLGTTGSGYPENGPRVSDAVGINDRGEALANSSVDQNVPVSYAFVWRNGTSTALIPPSDEASCSACSVGAAINERGQVAGWVGSDLGFGVGQAFLWSNGSVTDVGTLPGRQYSYALALNDRGAVVGHSYDVDDEGAIVRTHAFLWQDGAITDLGTLGGRTATANAINNHGQIVGSSTTRRGRTHAFLWQHGKMTDLGPFVPIADNDRARSHAFCGSCAPLAINDRGDVLASNGVWRHGTFIHLGTLGGKYSVANAINDKGQIVGSSATRRGRWHATLWTPRKS
jgi:probable HAF family extracellular repeat protein